MADIDKYKDEQMRCPMLGGDVNLKYCWALNGGKPCESVLVCWKDVQEVVDEYKNIVEEK